MNLLETLEKEITDNKKIICLTPYDRDFPFIFLTLQEYLECEDLSDLWDTGFVEEFEYTYHGENSLIHQLEEHHFKKLIDRFSKDDEIEFEELSKDILRWQYNYNEDVEVYFYPFNYHIKGDDGIGYYYDEDDLAKELFEEITGIELEDLESKHDCLQVSISTKCFFNQGNWHEIDYKEYQKMKIQFID